MPSDGATRFDRTVLDPAACLRLVPALAATHTDQVWVYRYTHPDAGWVLSIATHAEPGSGKLSLGGFRIAPEGRTSLPDYDNDAEAIGLAIGMEEKIYWSRLLHVGGPLALRDKGRIVGGKCVLRPTPDARVGQPRDMELLDFAIACFHDFGPASGVKLTTGQDLGHGTLSDGRTGSLEYMHARFGGSVLADTSKPTAEGNFWLLIGLLRGLEIEPPSARVGLIGAGNIGQHVLERLRAVGAHCEVLEAAVSKRAAIEKSGVRAWTPAQKDEFLRLPIDALVVNASGGTLDPHAVEIIAQNPTLRAVCGSENLTMPDPHGAIVLRDAGKIYCPTELGGMMGYLAAVEEYLAKAARVPFDLDTVFLAAQRLEEAGYEAASYVRRNDFRPSFEEGVREVFGAPA